jgi:hypothetical protein
MSDVAGRILVAERPTDGFISAHFGIDRRRSGVAVVRQISAPKLWSVDCQDGDYLDLLALALPREQAIFFNKVASPCTRQNKA